MQDLESGPPFTRRAFIDIDPRGLRFDEWISISLEADYIRLNHADLGDYDLGDHRGRVLAPCECADARPIWLLCAEKRPPTVDETVCQLLDIFCLVSSLMQVTFAHIYFLLATASSSSPHCAPVSPVSSTFPSIICWT